MPFDPKYGLVKLEKKPDVSDDEPCFVLRGQDFLAPIAMRFYADLVEGAIPPPGGRNMAANIREQAERMASWPPRKLPT